MRDSSLKTALRPRDFSGFGKSPGGSGGGAKRGDQSAGDYVRLPLDQIAPDLTQPRKLNEPQFQPSLTSKIDLDSTAGDELAELGRSIVASGVLIPLIVEQIGSNSYKIVAGHRRWLAAQAARDWVAKNPEGKGDLKPVEGWDYNTVPAIVRSFHDADRRLAAQLIENLARQSMTKQDVGHALEQLHKNGNYSYRALAALIGRSVGFVQDCFASIRPETTEVSRMFGDSEDWRSVQRASTLRKRDPANFERIRKQFENGEGSLRHLLDAFEREQEASPAAAPQMESRSQAAAQADEVGDVVEIEPDDEAEIATGDDDAGLRGNAPDFADEAVAPAPGGEALYDKDVAAGDDSEVPDEVVSPADYREEDQISATFASRVERPASAAAGAGIAGQVREDNVSVQISLPRTDALRLVRALRGAAGLQNFPQIDFHETPSAERLLDELHHAIKAVPSK